MITAGYCGNMECDGQKTTILHDSDGSFTGNGRAYLLNEVDQAWDDPAQRARGIGDHLIPLSMWIDQDGGRQSAEVVRPHTGRLSGCVYLSLPFFSTHIYI